MTWDWLTNVHICINKYEWNNKKFCMLIKYFKCAYVIFGSKMLWIWTCVNFGTVATCPSRASEGEAHGCAFQMKERCAESPPTFFCGKRRENRRKPVKMKILSSGVVFTFVEGISTSHVCLKGQQPIFRIVKLCYLTISFPFLFLRSTKVGLLLLRTLHRRGNQTYVVLFNGESSDSFYLEGDHFKALDLKNDPFYLVRKTEVLNLKILF